MYMITTKFFTWLNDNFTENADKKHKYTIAVSDENSHKTHSSQSPRQYLVPDGGLEAVHRNLTKLRGTSRNRPSLLSQVFLPQLSVGASLSAPPSLQL